MAINVMGLIKSIIGSNISSKQSAGAVEERRKAATRSRLSGMSEKGELPPMHKYDKSVKYNENAPIRQGMNMSEVAVNIPGEQPYRSLTATGAESVEAFGAPGARQIYDQNDYAKMMKELDAQEAKDKETGNQAHEIFLNDNYPEENRFNSYSVLTDLNKKWNTGLYQTPLPKDFFKNKTFTPYLKKLKSVHNDKNMDHNEKINKYTEIQAEVIDYVESSKAAKGIKLMDDIVTPPKTDTGTSWQRKTRTFVEEGKIYRQDYDYNPKTKEEEPFGTPYLFKETDDYYGDEPPPKKRIPEF